MIIFFTIIVLFIIGTISILISIFFENDQKEHTFQYDNKIRENNPIEKSDFCIEPETSTQVNHHNYSHDDDQDLIIDDDFDQEKIVLDDL